MSLPSVLLEALNAYERAAFRDAAEESVESALHLRDCRARVDRLLTEDPPPAARKLAMAQATALLSAMVGLIESCGYKVEVTRHAEEPLSMGNTVPRVWVWESMKRD